MSRSKVRPNKQQRDVTFMDDNDDASQDDIDFASSINKRVNPEMDSFIPQNRKRRYSDQPKENGGVGWLASLGSGKDSANAKALLLMAFLAVVLVRMSQATTQRAVDTSNVVAASNLRSSTLQQQQHAIMTDPPPGYSNAQLPPGYYFYPGSAGSGHTHLQQGLQSPLDAPPGGSIPQVQQHGVLPVGNAVGTNTLNQAGLVTTSTVPTTDSSKNDVPDIPSSDISAATTSDATMKPEASSAVQAMMPQGSGATVDRLHPSQAYVVDKASSTDAIMAPASVIRESTLSTNVGMAVEQSTPVTAQDIVGGASVAESTDAVTQYEGTTTATESTPLQNEKESLPFLAMFKDSWDPYETTDTPIFWHIPKAGGSTVKDVVGSCHRKVMATEFGVTDGHDKDTKIAVVYPKGGEQGKDRSPFVNVDTTTVAGIDRAKHMGFADSGLADMVVTPFIYEANELFTPTARGRLFSVFRHPIERAISMFYYIQVATWEPTYKPELQSWTLEQYATSDIVENNWMTRQLANALGGDLTDDHLNVAMDVIRRKFMVGLMTNLEETTSRFEKFFRLTFHVNPINQEKCRERLLSGGSNRNSKKKDKPQPGSNAWELLAHQNLYDLQLYAYIESLFQEQEAFVSHLPGDFRMVNSTCCKCDPPTYPEGGFICPKAVLN